MKFCAELFTSWFHFLIGEKTFLVKNICHMMAAQSNGTMAVTAGKHFAVCRWLIVTEPQNS